MKLVLKRNLRTERKKTSVPYTKEEQWLENAAHPKQSVKRPS